MAQQRLGCQYDQRLAQRTDNLTAQQVVNLRWSRWYAHLNVVLGAQLQVTLKTCRRVLRALTFVAVRQQHGQTAQTAPLVFTAGDELVNYNLSAVGEVAELSFPDNQSIRRGGRIAVFERQYRLFRQQRVVQVKTWLTLIQVLQRDVGTSIFLVVQYGMTVRERTAADVLTGHANRVTFERQGRVRHGFGITPVDRQAAGLHFLTIFVDLRNLALNHEAFRNFQQLGGQFLQGFEIKTRVVTRSPGVAQIRTPVNEQLFVRLFDQTFHNMQTVVQRVAVFVDLGLNAL